MRCMPCYDDGILSRLAGGNVIACLLLLHMGRSVRNCEYVGWTTHVGNGTRHDETPVGYEKNVETSRGCGCAGSVSGFDIK